MKDLNTWFINLMNVQKVLVTLKGITNHSYNLYLVLNVVFHLSPSLILIWWKLLLPIFGFPQNKMRKYKKIYQKIFRRNPKNNRSEKRMLEYRERLKLVEEVQKCKRLKFDNIFLNDKSPVDKENSSWGRKV